MAAQAELEVRRNPDLTPQQRQAHVERAREEATQELDQAVQNYRAISGLEASSEAEADRMVDAFLTERAEEEEKRATQVSAIHNVAPEDIAKPDVTLEKKPEKVDGPIFLPSDTETSLLSALGASNIDEEPNADVTASVHSDDVIARQPVAQTISGIVLSSVIDVAEADVETDKTPNIKPSHQSNSPIGRA